MPKPEGTTFNSLPIRAPWMPSTEKATERDVWLSKLAYEVKRSMVRRVPMVRVKDASS